MERLSEVLYQAVIPLNPRTKKNSQEIMFKASAKNGFYKKTKYGLKYVGIPFIAQNERYKQYENDASWFLKRISQPISEPVNVKCVFYRDTKRLCDLPNLLNAILDILRLYGIIEDDNRNIVYSVDGSKVLYDKENPRTEITITKAEDVQVWDKKSK